MCEEMKKACYLRLLSSEAKAIAMISKINKTDNFDARGLATLLRNGTLPSVWIPPSEQKDKKVQTITKMALVQMWTTIKTRSHVLLS